MFRLLLVEDNLNTLAELRELLLEVFPTSLVETASNVEDGLRKISVASAKTESFNIAILDFMLPIRKGENPEIEESLCQEIKSKMPETFVIHITAFSEDDDVVKHPTNAHAGVNAPRMALITKAAGWPEKLLGEIKSYLISRQLHDLFNSPINATSARKEARNGGSLTHKLAALSRDIAGYWHDLDDATKARVRKYFEITEDEQLVRATLRL